MLKPFSAHHALLVLITILFYTATYSQETPATETTLPAASSPTEDDEKVLLKIPSVMVFGRFDMAERKNSDDKPASGIIGVLVTKSEALQLKSKDDSILNDLKEKAGKLVTVEGKMREANGQTYLLVTRVVIKVLPPSGFRNPRGL